MRDDQMPEPNYTLLYFLLLPVLLIPVVVMAFLLVRGDQAEQYYNRGLRAASAGDLAAARAHFEKAGSLGHAPSDCNLALLYRSGAVTVDNAAEETLRVLTRAALNGSMSAEYQLGQLAENNTPPDYDLAVLHYRRAALGGDVDGLLAMGRLHEHGLGINKSALLAREFYLKAAESNSMAACTALGLLYISPVWGKADYIQAEKYLKIAAQANYARAFTALGYICEQKSADDAAAQQQAGKYYLRAAELNDPEGTVNYADYLYRHGLDSEALKYYRKAADELSFPLAWHRLGMFFYRQTEPDYTQARKYFEKSASTGNAASWINLGIMAELGQGGSVDMKKALNCYQMAEKLGHADAAKRIKNLQGEL
ncbi:MAG: sel1 repeat family protein [Lentisphaerae bacterium]|nr:sel1 repeat family protein [Lentisphaerota bacterium]